MYLMRVSHDRVPMDVYLMGVYLIGVYLVGRVSHSLPYNATAELCPPPISPSIMLLAELLQLHDHLHNTHHLQTTVSILR
jgi:hypothetical protein